MFVLVVARASTDQTLKNKNLMQPQNQHAEMGTGGASIEKQECPSCRSLFIRGMRFCRQCGYRLGEGVEEYVETRRFSGMPPAASSVATAATPASVRSASVEEKWGAAPMARMNAAPLEPLRPFSLREMRSSNCIKRMNWTGWVVLGVAVTMVASGGFIFKPISQWRGDQGVSTSAPRSFFGTQSFEDADVGDGALITSVTLPDSPAVQAGLIGGDVITSFDGQPVEDEDEMRELLAATPVGKTVEVIYLRDGETKQATLTTISSKEFKEIDFGDRPEGEGFLGLDPGDLERVAVPGTKIYGVQLGDVYRNRPGYLAGLREGDVVIEFNGTLIRTEKEFLSRINEALPDSTVKAVVMRGGERLEIPVKMGRD